MTGGSSVISQGYLCKLLLVTSAGSATAIPVTEVIVMSGMESPKPGRLYVGVFPEFTFSRSSLAVFSSNIRPLLLVSVMLQSIALAFRYKAITRSRKILLTQNNKV